MKTARVPGSGRAYLPHCLRIWLGCVAAPVLSLIVLLAATTAPAAPTDVPLVVAPNLSRNAQFDQANRFYEQAQYSNAIAAYRVLIQTGLSNSAVYFNLGNACYKSNQRGRAIAAYRVAERLTPRDPAVRFNLGFARRQVYGRDPAPGLFWRSWLSRLTLNEWTLMAAGGMWAWFVLLAGREWRPGLRRALRGYTATLGVLAGLLILGLILAAALNKPGDEAVVIVPQGIARYGPLAEAQVFYQLPDGSEVGVLDQRRVITAAGAEDWVQIRDQAQRIGWIKRDQLIVIE